MAIVESVNPFEISGPIGCAGVVVLTVRPPLVAIMGTNGNVVYPLGGERSVHFDDPRLDIRLALIETEVSAEM